ncbi:hypothetical protein [Streptomyces sp. NPDC006335]|uniref:hypothetical protein n=1 Tax=Streptomyces sp. NPDC006335 TaxID=3156895 RepID=UPI0033BA180E
MLLTHNADGEVTKVTDPLQHSRHSKYVNHLVQTATDAMGSGSDGTGGNTTTYGWDSRNNATSAKLPLGATASVTAYQTTSGTAGATPTTPSAPSSVRPGSTRRHWGSRPRPPTASTPDSSGNRRAPGTP